MQRRTIRSEADELHLRSRRISKDQSKDIVKNRNIKMSDGEDSKENTSPALVEVEDNSSAQEVIQPEKPVIDMVHFKQVDHDDKLDLIMAAINKVNTNFYYKFEEVQRSLSNKEDGLIPRVNKLENWCESVQKDISSIPETLKLAEENNARMDAMEEQIPTIDSLKQSVKQLEESTSLLRDDMVLLKGILQKQDKKIQHNETDIVDLKKRSMQNNIVIYGLTGDTKDETTEECKNKVLNFMEVQMKMGVTEDEVIVAHRLGKKSPNKDRPIVVRCQHKLKERVFDYTKNLQGLKNDKDQFFSVKPQLPEPLATQKRERQEKIREIKKFNKTISEKEKHKRKEVEVKDKMLFIDNVPQKKHVTPPTLRQIFNIPKDQHSKIDNLNIKHSAQVEEKGSIFTGHALRVKNSTEIRLAYKQLKLQYPESDHAILAYKVKDYDGYHDDGEHGAGQRLLKILHDRNTTNTALFVTREFGGIHLGVRRFVYIEKVAREVLDLVAAEP